MYEKRPTGIGDAVSDFLRDNVKTLKEGLYNLHTKGEMTFGQVGAEVTLFKIPETFDLARMIANRGLFLEVLPVLRLCLEMAAWSAVVFFLDDEDRVARLKAQACIPKLKVIYASAGRLYGYFSKFAHWEFGIQAHFLQFKDGQAAVVSASCRYRAMSLALCLVILDLVLEVVRHIYSAKSESLITSIQGAADHVPERRIQELVTKIVAFSKRDDFLELQSFLS